jgi:hypothetical protein
MRKLRQVMPLNLPQLSVDDIIAHCQPIPQPKQIFRQRMQLTSINQQTASIPVSRVAASCATIRAGSGLGVRNPVTNVGRTA